MFNIQAIKKGRKYINDSLLNGLVSYWKLNEASGTRSDSVGSNNLADNNTVTRATGKQSGAGNFTFSNSEYLNIASNSSLHIGASSFTFCAWVYLASKPTYAYILSKRNEETSEREYFLDYTSTTDRFRFGVSANGTTNTFVAADTFGAPSTGTWYFLIASYDADTDTLSLSVNNGTANTTAFSNTVFEGTGNFTIGGGNNTPVIFWDGYIDEVGFWKRVLTTEEKARLYNSGNGITYPFNSILDRLVSYWKMEETSGNRSDSNSAITLVDGNTVTYNNGIIGNGAQFTLANSEYFSTTSTGLVDFGDSNYTIACWVYLDSKPAGPNSMLIATKYQSDTVRDFLIQYVGSDQDFRFIVYDGSTSTIGIVSNDVVADIGKWYFLVVYHDATNNLVGISVNGLAPTTAATTGTAGLTASLFYVGNREGAAPFPWDGKIDEMGVWRRVLTPTEINYLYNNGRGKTYPLSPPMSRI